MAATEQQMLEALQAIDEEAPMMITGALAPEVRKGLVRIVKIARHKKDTRQSAPGSCTSDRAG